MIDSPVPTSRFERAAREQWLAWAVDSRYRMCDTCGRVRDDENRLLLVARQPHSRKFCCISCWDQGKGRGRER